MLFFYIFQKYLAAMVVTVLMVVQAWTAPESSAASWYVNDASTAGDSYTYTAGNDLTGLGTALLPYRTIGKALTSSSAGDTIFVDRGIFTEAVLIDKDSITLYGLDSAATVVDPPGDSTSNGLHAIEANNLAGLVIRNLRATGAYQGVRFNNVNQSVIRNVDAAFNGNVGIKLRNGSDSNLVFDNLIRFNLSDGVLITQANGGSEHSNNNSLINNSILSNSGNGIAVIQGSNGNRLIRNTVKFNSSDGIDLDGGGVPNSANNIVIFQNTIESNTGYQISFRDQAGGNAANKNNLRSSSTNPDRAVFTNSAGSIDFRRIWWNTTDEGVIRGRITGSAAGAALFIPYRLGVVDTSSAGDTLAPAPPDSITTDALVIGQITLSWSNPVADEDSTPLTGFGGVRVYRLKNRPDTIHWAANLVWTAAPGETRWIDTGVTPGQRYYYRLTSRDTAPVVNESFFGDTVVAFARDTSAWYVNDTSTVGDSFTTAFGSDTQPGTRTAPFRTIGRALDSATTGETIYVDRGVYEEAVVVGKDAISLIGVGSDATIIDPPGDSGANNVFGITATTRTRLLIRNLRVTGATGGILLDDKVSYSLIEGVEASSNGEFGVKFKGGATFNTIRDDTLAFNSEDGVIFARGSGNDPVKENALINNVILSNQRHGVLMAQGANATQTRLIRNTILQNRVTGVTIDGSGVGNASDNNVLLQNTIASNAGFQIQIFNHAANNVATRNNLQTWPANQGIFNDDAATYNFTRNWWSTTDEVIIRSRLVDSGGVGATFIPYRLGVVDTSMNGDTIAPAAPSGIKLDTSTAGQIAVSWSIPAVDEDSTSLSGFGGVKIYRLKNRADTTHWAANLVWIAGPPDTRWVDSELTPRQTYYYRLTSRDTAAVVNESFFGDTIFAKVFTAVVLSSPPDSHRTNLSPVQFAWNDLSNSDTFTWQLSKNPAFLTIADSAVDTGARNIVKHIPDQDTFFWRVIAKDTFGNRETSAVRMILLDTSADRVVLLSPADGHETSNASVVVRWAALGDSVGIDSYAVEVSKNSAFASLVFSDTVDGTQTADTLALVDVDTYYWRVRAFDNLGNAGPQSPPRGFFLDNEKPPVVDGVTASANLAGTDTGVYLTWKTSPATDSTGYHIYRASDLDSRLSVRINSSLITDSTGYLDTTAVRGDTQFYYVVAVDLRTNLSDSSALASAPHPRMEKIALAARLRPGDTLHYAITVVNDGFAPAKNVVIYDFRPANTLFSDSASAPAGWRVDYRVDSGANIWQAAFSDTADMVRFTAIKTFDPTLNSPSDTLTLRIKLQ